MPFSGFPEETLTFFRQLKKNNRREWFTPRKQLFESVVKAPMISFVEALNSHLALRAPDFVTDPSKAIYRIYRDTRFSSDKTPYKTHIAAGFWHRKLEKHGGAGLYVALSHEGLDTGGGIYMTSPEMLLAVRTLIAERHQEFSALAHGPKLRPLAGELQGDSLTRVPKGFHSGHPAAEMIRRKQWYFYVTLDPALALKPKIVAEIANRFDAMLPLIRFLNEPLLKQRAAEQRSRLAPK